jgi:adenine/guanine phosphoribosyltransferase-like PRPP-binding protein
VEKAGGVVAATSFVISLDDLPGKAKLAAAGYPVVSLLNYA